MSGLTHPTKRTIGLVLIAVATAVLTAALWMTIQPASGAEGAADQLCIRILAAEDAPRICLPVV